ncbi:MAG TPA: hypothetical protein VLL31_08590, partial [Sulfurovum sp.]|nr:hypothetical protein [Sulfurovum sp.]
HKIADICDDLSIPYGYKDHFIEALNEERIEQNLFPYSLGSTEMGRLVNASGGSIQGTTFQLPTTGYHTTKETVSMAAVIDAIKILETLYIEEG